jgi:hypothetical protein
MKTPASIIALMCLNHPEFSRPLRNSLIVGVFNSQTKTEKAEIETDNHLSLFIKKGRKWSPTLQIRKLKYKKVK